MARYSVTIQFEEKEKNAFDIVEGDLKAGIMKWNDEGLIIPMGYSSSILGTGEQHIDTRLSSPEKKSDISPE